MADIEPDFVYTGNDQEFQGFMDTTMLAGDHTSRPYACQICHKRFTQKAHLITHKRTHTGEKPYACHICHKRFAQSSHLSTHKRIHTGEKPYFCTLCKVGYCRKQRLEQHLLQHSRDALVAANMPVTEDHEVQQRQLGINVARVKTVTDDHEVQQHQLGINVASIKTEAGTENQNGSVFPESFNMNTQIMNHSSDMEFSNRINHSKNLNDSGCMATAGGIEFSNHTPPKDSEVLSGCVATTQDDNQPAMFLSHRRKPSFVNRISNSQDTDVSSFGDQCDNVHQIDDNDIESKIDNSRENNSKKVNSTEKKQNSSHVSMEEGFSDKIYPMCSDKLGNQNRHHDTVQSGSGEDIDGASVTSESNMSGSELSVTTSLKKRSLLTSYATGNSNNSNRSTKPTKRFRSGISTSTSTPDVAQIGVNSRICLVNFTSDDLLTHMMSRDDVFKCDFCCIVFQDAAMYHLHRSQHDKMDIRCCNLCGQLAQDKYDFTAHYLSEHK